MPRSATSLLVLLASLLLTEAGCRREPPSPAAPTGSAALAPAPVATSAAAATAQALSPADDARRLASSWTTALNAADTSALAALYADPVRYYGKPLSRSGVLAAKARALAASKPFEQAIVGDVAVDAAADGALVLRFTKRSGPAGRLRDVGARLVVGKGDAGALVIREESDEAADKQAADKRRASCMEVAERAVNELAQVKRALADIQRDVAEAGGRARAGGIGPLSNDDGGFSGGYGVHTDERYEARVWYSVDAGGALGVTIMGENIAIPSDAQKKVRAACAP